MTETRSRQIIVAGAGIAGLTAAIAFARHGFAVRVYEKATKIEEIGAGIQLSPNASRLLDDLGLLDSLMPAASQPEAVVLRSARSKNLKELARVPLRPTAEERWGAPYLVMHRADLQSALLSYARHQADITITTGAAVRDMALHPFGVTASIDVDGRVIDAKGLLLVGADGVWSSIRGLAGDAGKSKFTGKIAWRATIRSEGAAAALLGNPADVVTAFLAKDAHLIAYPVRAGAAINLVAVTEGDGEVLRWDGRAETALLKRALRSAAPPIRQLIDEAGTWTTWPIHTVDPAMPWTISGGVALIGDAAHAMTPYAAQGAAMAIEDAVLLADRVATAPGDIATALTSWERERRARVARVMKRGALNERAWHARGPVVLVRNMVLRSRSSERLAADLDWLYGWRGDIRAEPS
ncbi:MAG: FAD-dependent monooxygenase [Rhizobiaceae bacterium]